MTDSPYLTRAEVAEYTRRHPYTVYRAWVAYRQSGGTRGLRGHQPSGPNGTVTFLIDDVDRWLNGEAPLSGSRKLRRSA